MVEGALDLRAGQAGGGAASSSQSVGAGGVGELLEAVGVLASMNVVVEPAPVASSAQEQPVEGLEEGQVAAEADLQEQVGERGAAADQAARGLRVLEAHQAGLGQRVDRDDLAPPALAFSSAESIRGWLVPGFWPTTKIRSAWWRSSRRTLPLPMPMVSVSAEPQDSWHMLEQSGRLLVPKARAKSW